MGAPSPFAIRSCAVRAASHLSSKAFSKSRRSPAPGADTGVMTASSKLKASGPLLQHLAKTIEQDEEQRKKLVSKIKGIVIFKIDGEEWVLDLREGQGTLTQGGCPDGEQPDLTLTIGDENFAKMVIGKLGPQQAFLMRKLKIQGSMALAMKLQPILDAAAPKAKL